jgi:hypothetical protein
MSETIEKKPKRARRVPDLPRVVPFKRACDESGFSYTTMRDAAFRGELTVIKVGRNWYVAEAEFRRFAEANTQRFAMA